MLAGFRAPPRFEPVLKRHGPKPQSSSWFQAVERLRGCLADTSIAIDLEVLQVVFRVLRVKRSQRLGRRHPDLPVAVDEGPLDDGNRRPSADPPQRSAGNHSLA